MGLLDTIDQDYRNKWGFLRGKKPGYTENGLAFTSNFFTLAVIKMDPDKDTKKAWRKEWRDLIAQCEVKPGLYRRQPDLAKINALDDYTCIAAASKKLGDYDVANEILDYGLKNWYNWNDQDEGKLTWNSFMGKSPSFLTHLRECVKDEIGVIERWVARRSMSLSWSSDKGNTSNKVLAYMISAASGDPDMKELFQELVHEQYDSSEEIFKIYFGARHPITKLFDFKK